MLRDEIDIEDALTLRLSGVVAGEDVFTHSENGSDVAARFQLMILRADLRFMAGDHLGWILRIDEEFESSLPNRIEGDYLHAAPRRILQGMQKARTVRAGILAEEEHGIAALQILIDAGADAGAENFGECDRGRLVAHVGTVGQIVVAIKPREKRVEIRGFEAGVTGGIEDRRFRIERLEFAADRFKGLVPAARHIVIAGAIVTHRLCQPALLFEIVVLPCLEFADAVPGEKLRRAEPARQLP